MMPLESLRRSSRQWYARIASAIQRTSFESSAPWHAEGAESHSIHLIPEAQFEPIRGGGGFRLRSLSDASGKRYRIVGLPSVLQRAERIAPPANHVTLRRCSRRGRRSAPTLATIHLLSPAPAG